MTTPTTEQQQPGALGWLAAWLVMNHQSEQRDIAARLAKKLAPLWKILDVRDLKGTRAAWIETVLPEVEAAYQESQRTAQGFAIDYRHANLPAVEELPAVTGQPTGPVDLHRGGQPTAPKPARPSRTPQRLVHGNPMPPDAPPTPSASATPSPAQVITDTELDRNRAIVSLVSTGPGEVAHRIPSTVTVNVSQTQAPETQVLEQQASRAGEVKSTGVAVRTALDGGRQVIRRAVELDHEAIGWARVLNISPCYFCAMLASRGAVYKANSFAASTKAFDGAGVAKVHDFCRCGLRPVYSYADFRDPTAVELSRQWDQHTDGFGGQDAINAFRRNYTPPTPPEAPRIDLHSLIVARDRLITDGFAENSTQVVWMDRQIARFGAILAEADVPPAMTELTRSRRRAPQRRPTGTTPGRRTLVADTTSRQTVDAPPSGR